MHDGMRLARRTRFVHLGALLVLFAGEVSGQVDDPPAGLVNGDMESLDETGQLAGWRVPQTLRDLGYEAGPERDDVHAGALAARIDSRAATPTPNSFGNLMQSFDATPWRGKRVRYRAAVKVAEAEEGGRAQLWLRVDRASVGNTPARGFFDNMGDRPITSGEWQSYEIVGDIDAEATRGRRPSRPGRSMRSCAMRRVCGSGSRSRSSPRTRTAAATRPSPTCRRCSRSRARRSWR
jgi:hypothetical protein